MPAAPERVYIAVVLAAVELGELKVAALLKVMASTAASRARWTWRRFAGAALTGQGGSAKRSFHAPLAVSE